MWPLIAMSVIAAVVVLAAYIFCFVFALSKRHLSSRASNLALTGIGLFFLSWLVGRVVPTALAQTVANSQLGFWITAVGLVNAVLSAIGFVLLIVAVFVDREPRKQDPDNFLPGDDRSAIQERNPYAASPVDSK